MSRERRPDVPAAVARQLRQEAGFGCCICGSPIYDYQHIIPYSKDHHFRPEDMMLLCPNHHREATAGALKEHEQRYFKANPHNISRGYVDGMMKINQQQLNVYMGSNLFQGDIVFIAGEHTRLLALGVVEDGRILFDANIFGPDGNLVLSIDDNQWISGWPEAWDVEFRSNYLKIWKKSRDIVVEIDLRNDECMLISGTLWYEGINISIKDDQILMGGKNVIKSIKNTYVNCGIYIDRTGIADCASWTVLLPDSHPLRG